MTGMLANTLLIAATALGFVAPVFGQIKITDPWVRATVPQQKATGAFMTVTATTASRLVQVASPVAAVVELHEMSMENNVMKMRAIAGLDLPAGKPVQLKPGGYHVMLIDLKQQVKDGETVPITLVFEDGDKKQQTVKLDVPVRPLTAAANSSETEHKH